MKDYTYHPTEERVLIKKVYYLNQSLKETVYYVSNEFVRVVNTSGAYNTVYVKHEGQLVAELKPSGNKVYYPPDHLGSTTLITNQSGNVVMKIGSLWHETKTLKYTFIIIKLAIKNEK